MGVAVSGHKGLDASVCSQFDAMAVLAISSLTGARSSVIPTNTILTWRIPLDLM